MRLETGNNYSEDEGVDMVPINKQNFFEFLRFCTVGIGNTAVDFIVFFILTHAGLPLLLAQGIAYSAGAINSFYFNRRWTFRDAGNTVFWEAVRFGTVNGLALLVSAALLFICRDSLRLTLWSSKLAATGAGTAINYIGSRCWVFKEKQVRGDLCEN